MKVSPLVAGLGCSPTYAFPFCKHRNLILFSKVGGENMVLEVSGHSPGVVSVCRTLLVLWDFISIEGLDRIEIQN